MCRQSLVFVAVSVLTLFSCACESTFAGNQVDSIQFGNPQSEQSHKLNDKGSEIVEGALGLSARKILPKSAAHLSLIHI